MIKFYIFYSCVLYDLCPWNNSKQLNAAYIINLDFNKCLTHMCVNAITFNALTKMNMANANVCFLHFFGSFINSFSLQ